MNARAMCDVRHIFLNNICKLSCGAVSRFAPPRQRGKARSGRTQAKKKTRSDECVKVYIVKLF